MDMDIPSPLPVQPVRFLERLRAFIRMRGLAYKTEKTYVFWIKRFIRFHDRQHPEAMGALEVEAFLSHLAVFSPQEAKAAIDNMEDEYRLIAMLIYGAGLRINEVLRLRVRDVDFGM